jgi:hypothetical protein
VGSSVLLSGRFLVAVRAARSVLSNRRFDRLVALPAAALLLASVVQAVPAGAAGLPGDPGASDVVVGLIRLGGALGAASQQPALSDHLPLTDESVRDVLQLDTALGRHVTDDVTGANATLDTLPAAFANDPALKLAEVTPSAGAPAGSREWILSVSLKGSVPVTLAYQDDRLQFGAAELTGELAGTLTGDIRIRYDASQIPLRRFSVVGESQLTTHVWTRGVNSSATTGQTLTAPSFKAVDGFVQLDAQGTGTVDSSTVLRLRDPNGRGALTTEDLEFSDPQELFTTQILPGADDVHMQFDLSTDLLGSGTHGSVSVGTRAASSQDPYATPAITRDATLDRLTSLTRTQALTGFTQYVTALTGAESAVDAGLPMLDANLTDLYSPGNKLLSLMTQQATAAISCGAADTSPPTGAPRPGEVRYCQATTSGLGVDAGTDITWGSPDPGVTVTGDTAGTIGTAPSANVRVSGGGGFPVLTVSFTNGGQRRTARTVVSSIQQLGSAVHDLGLDGTLTYDTSRQSLEVAVQQHQAAALTTNVATGGNGNLAPLTGLTGLCEAAVGTTPRACPRTRPDTQR